MLWTQKVWAQNMFIDFLAELDNYKKKRKKYVLGIAGSLKLLGLLYATIRNIIVFTWMVMFLFIWANSVAVPGSCQLSFGCSPARSTDQKTLFLGKL